MTARTRHARPPFSLDADSDHARLIGTGYTALSYAKAAADAARRADLLARQAVGTPASPIARQHANAAAEFAREAADAALDALGPVVNADGDPEDVETARLHCAAVIDSATAAGRALDAARKAVRP